MKIEITTRRFELEPKIKGYVKDKMGVLEKYVPRGARGNSSVEVVLEDDASGREDNRFVCEVVMTVGGETLVSREGTINMFAAVDIVEAKLKAQLAKYKDKHMLEPRRHRMLARLMGELSGGVDQQ